MDSETTDMTSKPSKIPDATRRAELKAKISARSSKQEVPVAKGMPTGQGKRTPQGRDKRHPYSTLSLSRHQAHKRASVKAKSPPKT